MKRRVLCIFVLSCLLISGCSTKKEGKDTMALPKRTKEAMVLTVSPKEDLENSEIKEIEPGEYFDEDKDDFGANDYWCEVMKRQKEEIDEMVEWFKGVEYCESLTLHEGFFNTIPDNKKTRKRLRGEKGFKEMKQYICEKKYSIRNNWLKEKRIIILHRFDDMEDIEEFDPKEKHGNFCLVYVGNELKKRESHYKKVDENYYSEVIFYE